MLQVGIAEIKKDISSYLEKVEDGETLLVYKEGKPLAEIKPLHVQEKGLRRFGIYAGEFIVPDDFDDPLPEDIMMTF